jgi:hypothetical protein
MSTAEKIALVEKAVALHDALDAQWALAAEVFDGITGDWRTGRRLRGFTRSGRGRLCLDPK